MNRRELLQGWVAGLAPEVSRSAVAIARDAGWRDASTRLAALLDRAVQAVAGGASPLEAWRNVARPGEVVGLKVNCLSGRGGSTHVALVEAVSERLQQAGIRTRDILVFDRLNSDLESAGFRIQTSAARMRVMGNDALGYGRELLTYGDAGSLTSNAVGMCDAIINLPVLKDHGIVGVTGALKNLFGAIHNPNKYHINAGDPYVADVYMLPPIRRKVRLHILDGLVAQYEGGPSYMPQWCWPFNGLLASRDPVALDTVAWRLIEEQRAARGIKTLKAAGREPLYISTAARYGIGANAPDRIKRWEV